MRVCGVTGCGDKAGTKRGQRRNLLHDEICSLICICFYLSRLLCFCPWWLCKCPLGGHSALLLLRDELPVRGLVSAFIGWRRTCLETSAAGFPLVPPPLRWVVARALALLSGRIVRARVQSPAVDNFLQTMCVKMQQVHHRPQTRMAA